MTIKEECVNCEYMTVSMFDFPCCDCTDVESARDMGVSYFSPVCPEMTPHMSGVNTSIPKDMPSSIMIDVKEDIVKRPSHYTQFKIEPITFVMENDLPFHVGNIIKYACRAGYKIYEGKDKIESEIIDLEKVRRYAEMRINLLQGKGVLGNNGPEPRRCL